MTLVYLDLTEIMSNPFRSGIQRVEREAIRHWDGRLPCPCVFAANGRVLRLSPEVFEVLCAEDVGSLEARAAERTRLSTLLEAGQPVPDEDVGRLLNLELFFDPVRADGHLRLSAAGTCVSWYLYDFLPFLRPELFQSGLTRHRMHFLRGLRAASDRVAFLSEQTREDFGRRIARRLAPPAGWPVFHPGADGLGLERQSFRPDRRDFVAIATIEPRKNADVVLDGFAELWKRGLDARLLMAGRISPEATQAIRFLELHRHEPRLTVLEHPSDEMLRSALRHARAVVMASEAEGFGLPPYEALHAGIPAIASARLPSATLMSSGAMLLPRMNAAAIATAVEAMLDDAFAAAMWAEAVTLDLPRWRDFGRSLAAWAREA